jgi:hypothetical protein
MTPVSDECFNCVAAVAMANKTSRMIWAVLTRNEPYKVRIIKKTDINRSLQDQ